MISPTIVPAEVVRVAEKRVLNVPADEILERSSRMPGITIAPFDFETFDVMRQLPAELDLHGRIIAATARNLREPPPHPG